MFSKAFRNSAAQALRTSGRVLQRGRRPLVPRSFLVVPHYQTLVAAHGFATAKKPAAKKPAAKTARKTTASAKKSTKPVKSAKTARSTKVAKTSKASKLSAKSKKVAKKPVKKPVKRAARKVAKKPVKKKGKKVLSALQKSALLKQKRAALKRDLKTNGLVGQEPKQLGSSPWMVHVLRFFEASDLGGADFAGRMKSLATEFNNLPAAQKTELVETAKANKLKNAANYKKWVESHSVKQIMDANKARASLRRIFKIKTSPLKIHDERLPPKPSCSAYLYFSSEKSVNTQMKPLRDHVRKIADEWNGMSDAQKKPYFDKFTSERARYAADLQKALA